MATVSTPATLNSVKSVFGGPNNLLAYLRGGSYVPNDSVYAAVATAAPLVLSSFAGLIYPYTNVIGCYTTSNKAASATASVSYSLGSSIESATTNGAVGAFSRTWRVGGNASDYECYLSGTGTTPTGSALNTWLGLLSTRSWSLSAVDDSKTFSGTIQVRLAASPFTVIDSASVFLEVTSEP